MQNFQHTSTEETFWGTNRSFRSPNPKFPYRPQPHPKSSPSSVTAAVCSAPAATIFMDIPYNRSLVTMTILERKKKLQNERVLQIIFNIS